MNRKDDRWWPAPTEPASSPSSSEPDGGGQSEQTLGDACEHPGRGAPAVSFQTELTLQGLVDGFDPLTNAAEVAVAVGLVLAVRTQ
jgi:hypothetical protein